MIKVTGSEGIEYIINGGRYWPEEALKEALGCKDDDIFGEIKKLKEERERYKSNCDYFAGIAQDRLRDRNKLELGLREALGTVDEYADVIGLVRKLKKERDELKEKCDKMKKRANAVYGTSCGYSEYSGDKAPAFRCNVISYSWNFGLIAAHSLMDEPSYPISSDSIRVELDLTPTANYKGAFDLEDLKHYIQAYGREKKLGVVESVDYQNAKAARAELAYLYKTVLGKEELDRDLSPHEVMKAILDEYKRVRDSQFAFSQCLRSVYMEIHEGTGYDINDIYAAPDKLAECIITRYNSARMSSRLETLSEIDEHIDELCDKYNVVQPLRKSTTKERLDYIFGVLAEQRDLANNNFNKAEGFRKEKRAVEDSLAELRAKIREIYRSVFCECRWEDGYSHCSALNDINEEYKRVKDFFKEKNDELKEVKQEYSRYCLAIGSLCNIPAEHRDDISWIEDAFNHTKKDYLKWQTQADKLARLRSNICTALCLGGETDDEDILKRVRMTKECHDALCKDYTDLRKAIWDAMDRKPETLPDETAKLVGEVRMLQLNNISLKWMHDEVAKAIGMDYPVTNNDIVNRVKSLYDANGSSCDVISDLNRQVTELKSGEKLLIEFRDAVAKAIGMDYPTTNQVILNNVQYIYKDREDAYKIVYKLNDQVTALSKAKEDLQKDYNELGEAYSSVLKWNNSYADVRRLLEVPADADASVMVGALNKFVCDYEKLKKDYDELNGMYKVVVEWNNSYDELRSLLGLGAAAKAETLIAAVKMLKNAKKNWYARYESEHTRANGEHKRAEKCFGEIAALKTQVASLERSLTAAANEQVGLDAFRNECRKLREEKDKVINALGQDIWDDCLK